MGKMLRQQRRGKGGNAYRKPPNTYKADVEFGPIPKGEKIYGEVMEFIDDPGHTAPLMKIKYDDKSENMLFAPEGMKVGDRIQEGSGAEVKRGSIMPLQKIPDGMLVYNIEEVPGDGGKYARAAGNSATIVSHSVDSVTLLMPSKKMIDINQNCRAQIGIIAGGGMGMMPILKAGRNFYIKHATNAHWPVNRGVKMNPVDHPFGGKQHHKGTSSTVSRNAPPGAKVGHIAARRTGRRKRG